MKNVLLPLLIFILLLSCNKDDNHVIRQKACDTDPLEISWIKEMKNSMQNCNCEMSIIQGTYNGQTVFYVGMTDPLCDGISSPILLDCSGNIVRRYSYSEYSDFLDEVTNRIVLYRCKKTQ